MLRDGVEGRCWGLGGKGNGREGEVSYRRCTLIYAGPLGRENELML